MTASIGTFPDLTNNIAIIVPFNSSRALGKRQHHRKQQSIDTTEYRGLFWSH